MTDSHLKNVVGAWVRVKLKSSLEMTPDLRRESFLYHLV